MAFDQRSIHRPAGARAKICDGVPADYRRGRSRRRRARAHGTDVAVLDTPAGVYGPARWPKLLRRADALLVPVLPSPIDMRAAARVIGDLLKSGRIARGQTRVGLIANRAHRAQYVNTAIMLRRAATQILDDCFSPSTASRCRPTCARAGRAILRSARSGAGDLRAGAVSRGRGRCRAVGSGDRVARRG